MFPKIKNILASVLALIMLSSVVVITPLVGAEEKGGTGALQRTVNTYDDGFFKVYEKRTYQDGKESISICYDDGSNIDFCSGTKIPIAETEDEKGNKTNAVLFEEAKSYSWQWPRIFRIYSFDGKDNFNGKFTPKATTMYKIKLKYKVEAFPAYSSAALQLWSPNMGLGNPSRTILVNELCSIKEKSDGWLTAQATFAVGANAYPLAIAFVSTNESDVKDTKVFVDDIEVEEIENTARITYDSKGGNALAPTLFLPESDSPNLSIPKKNNSIFEGWYLDDSLTKPYNYDVMPKTDITLYAKWSAVPTEQTSINTGFEKSEYTDGTAVYTNGKKSPDDVNPLEDTNISDNTSTRHVTWFNEDAVNAALGEGYLKFENKDDVITQNALRLHSVAVLNSDGTPFKMISGKRYHIKYDGYFTANSISVVVATSTQTPAGGIEKSNYVSEFSFEKRSLALDDFEVGEWGTPEKYIIAQSTGNVYLLQYGGKGEDFVCIDNLVIEESPANETVKVSYYQKDKKTLIGERIGRAGDLLLGVNVPAVTARRKFDGWKVKTTVGSYKKDTFYSSCYFPDTDISLYVSDAATGTVPEHPYTEIDWSKDVVVDFEGDGCKKFYDYTMAPSENKYVNIESEEEAHTGSGSLQFYKVGHWMDQYFRRFPLYLEDSPVNRVWLEPNSNYKLTYYLRLEAVGTANIYTVLFNDTENFKMSSYEIVHENFVTEADDFDNFGKWVKVEQSFRTEEEETFLGIVMYGGYTTCAFDDFVITKLSDITVTFDSNGGSEVDPIEQLNHSLVFQPKPPTKENFVFAGWFADKELTNAFDFINTVVTEDTTLYAKWDVAPPEPAKKYKTLYNESSEEQDVENKDADPLIKNQLQFSQAKKEKTSANESTGTANAENNALLWWIFGIIAALVVVAGLIIVLLVVKRKKSA